MERTKIHKLQKSFGGDSHHQNILHYPFTRVTP